MTYHSYGKFDKAITEVLYNITLDSGQDEDIGDAESLGWFARFNGGLDKETVEMYATGNFSVELEEDDYIAMESCIGAILQNDSQGFVYSQLYSSVAEQDKEWNVIVQMYEELEDDEEDGEN